MRPDGWPRYRAKVQQAKWEVATAAAGLTLKTNGVDLAPAFGGLVLFSAINEEFAPQYLGGDELPERLQQAARHFASRPPADSAGLDPSGRREANSGGATGAGPGLAGRSAPCACGSGKRYKHCCGRVD